MTTRDHTQARTLANETLTTFRAALRQGDLEQASEIVDRYASDRDRRPATLAHLRHALMTARAKRPDGAGSCKQLCELHMVEVCNNDRELWHEHELPWVSTACGKQRSEAFLQECYLRQWLSGTFQEACLAPCGETAAGRARLLHILNQSGCRVNPS